MNQKIVNLTSFKETKIWFKNYCQNKIQRELEQES